MRIRCNICGGTSTIQSSDVMSDEVKKLYCTCKNPECGHSFVMDLSFSHTLSPSAIDFPAELLKRIQNATRLEQQKIFSALSPVS